MESSTGLRVNFATPIPSVRSLSERGRSASASAVHHFRTSPLLPAALSPTFCFYLARTTRMACGGRGMTSTATTPPMASEKSATVEASDVIELKDESDFDILLQAEDFISICGFGSLLSERSARSTFPDLRNFRVARLNGFRRVFAHIAPIFFDRGIANQETGEISSLSAEAFEGESLVVTVFEIKRSEVPSFIEREHEFRFLAVTPEDLNGTSYVHPAVLCARYSDEEYFHIRCKVDEITSFTGGEETFFQRYGRYNIQKIWRDDILPCRVYLRHCVLAAKSLGEAAGDNFLDHTFLGDRKTTIRQYLSSTGAGIMEEEPPEALKTRYAG